MRQGQQNRRGRGRNRKGQNPLSRSFESNGPGVKIRGTAAHIAEKYMSLARDAQSSGDSVQAENYLQHAEHYNRIIMAAQSQLQQPMDGANGNGGRMGHRQGEYLPGDDLGEGDWDEGGEPAGQMGFGQQPQHQGYGQPRDPFAGREPREHREHQQREPREFREGGQQRFVRQHDYARQPQPPMQPAQPQFGDEQPEPPRADTQSGPAMPVEGEGGMRGEGTRPQRQDEREGGGFREGRRPRSEEGGFRPSRRRRHGGNGGGQQQGRESRGSGGFANGVHESGDQQQPQPQSNLTPERPKDGNDGTPGA
jgi:hypothetical protein